MNTLVLTGITKAYGPHPVLHGVDLTVENGSLTAILGASGSGKTTLLRVIAGFERADGGSVRLGDTVMDDGSEYVSPAGRRIGYVPQEGVLFPHLNVLGNVAFGLPRRDRHSARVRELLEMVGLDGLEDRFPDQLSGGQQQRVALARALAVSPAIILLDEPFAALDASLRASVRADVTRILSAAGTTAVLVTHDQDEALSMASHVAVLRDGRIVQHGTPSSLYRSPVDAGVAEFVGEANLIPGSVLASVATTALGALPVRGGAPDGPAVVLVRPEQVRFGSSTGSGVPGRVVGCQYFGHDAMLEVAWPGSHPLLVRVTGGDVPSVGSDVCLAATGSVTAWPAG